MTNQNNNHVFAKILAFLIIIGFIYVTNSNPNTKVPDRPPTSDQKKAMQKEKDAKAGIVRDAQDIPARVYENTLPSDKFANFLRANRKIIYYAYLGDCTDDNVFLDDLERLMNSHSELKSLYYYYPDPQERTSTVYCNKTGTVDCIQNYLFQNCANNMCIINPYKKQIIKISNKNFRQAFDRIYKYKNW